MLLVQIENLKTIEFLTIPDIDNFLKHRKQNFGIR